MTELDLALLIGRFMLNEELCFSQKRQLLALANMGIIYFGENDSQDMYSIKIRKDIRKDLFPHQGDISFVKYLRDYPDNYNILIEGLNNIYPKGYWDSVLSLKEFKK